MQLSSSLTDVMSDISLQVQDKSYFLGLLRTRIAELGTEMGRLGSEIELMKQEQSTFLTYDKRVKEMAQELTGQLIYTFQLTDIMHHSILLYQTYLSSFISFFTSYFSSH